MGNFYIDYVSTIISLLFITILENICLNKMDSFYYFAFVIVICYCYKVLDVT